MAKKRGKVGEIRKKANQALTLDGDKATVPVDTESRFVQLTLDTGCGLMCHACQQFKEKLCFGCYNACKDDIRNCLTTNCDIETTERVEQPDGSFKVLRGPCGVRCCKRYNIEEWVEAVSGGRGTLSIQGIRWEPFALPRIGRFIPSINGPVDKCPLPYVSIPLNRVYSFRTDRVTDKHVQDMFDLHPKTKVILNGYCQDPIIEKFWVSYRAKKHLQKLRRAGIQYAVGLNYSVYHGQPRMEHLLNIARTFNILEDMQNVGIKVIPDLCWHNSADLQQFVTWINNNYVQHVSMSFQLSRDDCVMARNMMDLEYITKNCPGVKRWIVNGPTTPHRVILLQNKIPNMVLMNSRAYQLSKYYMVWDYSCNEYIKCIRSNGKMIERAEAMMRNYKFFCDLMEGKNLHLFGEDYWKK